MKHKVKFELFIPERSLLERKLRSMHCLQNYCSLDSHQMNSNKSIICISTKKKNKNKTKQTNKTTVFVFRFSTTWILAKFFIAWFWNNRYHHYHQIQLSFRFWYWFNQAQNHFLFLLNMSTMDLVSLQSGLLRTLLLHFLRKRLFTWMRRKKNEICSITFSV